MEGTEYRPIPDLGDSMRLLQWMNRADAIVYMALLHVGTHIV
jgi:hypothetical protein